VERTISIAPIAAAATSSDTATMLRWVAIREGVVPNIVRTLAESRKCDKKKYRNNREQCSSHKEHPKHTTLID
jgi:hypothetical protein